MTFARSELQVTRLHEEIASARDIGIGPDDLSWVDETDLDGTVVTAVFSKIIAPSRDRTEPRTSRAGSMRAQCGENIGPAERPHHDRAVEVRLVDRSSGHQDRSNVASRRDLLVESRDL